MLVLIVCLLAAGFSARFVTAGFQDNPPPLPGFTHTGNYSADSAQKHGLVLPGDIVVRSSPAIANISTVAAGSEIAVVDRDGLVSVYSATGGLLWSRNVYDGAASCSVSDGDLVRSSPAVGDLENDGTPDVVIGYGPVAVSSCDGGVVVLNGNTGAIKWRYSLRDLTTIPENMDESLFTVAATPALADTDGDGTLEIGFGGFDRNVHLLNHDGSQRWYYHAADTVWSSPAFVDVDGDAVLELVIGADITANAASVPPTPDGGYIYAFKTAPRLPASIPFREGFIWQTYLDQAVYSSPAIGDVLASNPGMEIVVGSSCWHPVGSANKIGRWVKILRMSDGAVLSTLNTPACSRSSPALGDIDSDGKLEIVSLVTGEPQYGGSGKSFVIAWDPDTGAQKWTFTPNNPNLAANHPNGNDPNGDDIQSAVIADLDGNGSLEVLTANIWAVHVMRGDTGAALTCQSNTCGSQTSLFTWYTLKSTPAVGDVDGDGDLEVVIAGGHNFDTAGAGVRGHLYVWSNIASASLSSPPGALPAYSAPWPQFRGSAARTGVVAIPALGVSPAVLRLLDTTGSPGVLQGQLQVVNVGGATLDWSANASSGLSVTPDNGSISLRTQLTVQATVGAATPGVYTLGTIMLTSSNAVNGPLSVTVERRVGPLLFLPLIRR
jgi:hypothetical protein